MTETLFQTFSFIAAAASAWLWSRASRIRIPTHTGYSLQSKGPFSDALAQQAKVNGYAATGASLAAFFQAIAIASKVFGLSY